MNILFLRESEGVYQFGKKRVYVKIDKANQIQVRVGGGYMHIDQFINLYTPQEVDKIERKQVMDRYSDKLIIQKISSNVSDGAREKSPILLPQRPKSVEKNAATDVPQASGGGTIASRIDSNIEIIKNNPLNLYKLKQNLSRKVQRSPVTQRSNRQQIPTTNQYATPTPAKRGSQAPSPEKMNYQIQEDVDLPPYNFAGGRNSAMSGGAGGRRRSNVSSAGRRMWKP